MGSISLTRLGAEEATGGPLQARLDVDPEPLP